MRLNLLRPVVDTILRRHGVPAELAAVILVESGGRANALSPKGARGLWQLMPETARRYGLRVDEIRDDRLDLFSATDAAARYLHDLYAEFGDWKLALAAYNTGEANVGSAILKAHTQDFDQLATQGMLPFETRNYVPRVLAAAQSIGQSSAFGNASSAATVTTVFAVSNR
jgi:membrane-bound lytic murein transglycosylase D